MNTTTAPLVRRRGRPTGSRSAPPEHVVRLPVHLTVHRQRHPLLSEWLRKREPGCLAGDVVELMERALAGEEVGVRASGEGEQTQVYEIDMSGLMEWD